MRAQLLRAVRLFAALSLVTGVFYPLALTGLAQLLFPARANGSIVVVDGRAVGSRLIGQPFSAPGYFWSRPSATAPMPYDASASGGSNFGPTNPSLLAEVQRRVAALRRADPTLRGGVPVDLVTSSGSGLDPDITLAAALAQVDRVARARRLPVEVVRKLAEDRAEGRTLGFLGEPRVNVLLLDLALDSLAGGTPPSR